MAQRKLNKNSAHRQAMLNNMATELFRRERIETTLSKAKELRSFSEKLITAAKVNTLSSRRKILKSIKDKTIVRKLFDDLGPRFNERPGGYTRIIKLYPRRGDATQTAIIELVE